MAFLCISRLYADFDAVATRYNLATRIEHVNFSPKNSTVAAMGSDARLVLNEINMAWVRELYTDDYRLYAKHC